MDKKTEMRNRSKALESEAAAPEAATLRSSAPVKSTPVDQLPSGWWMYHGDPEHTGFVSDSNQTVP